MDELPRIEGVTSRISEFVRGIPEGKLFTTRDLLSYGKRGAVDQATRRMVNKRILQRVARGVFCKIGVTGDFCFPAWEVARTKAEAFGRQVATLCSLLPDQLGELAFAVASDAALVTSGTSKFEAASAVVSLDSAAHRKIRLGDTKAGSTARAVWRSFPHPGRGKGKHLSELFLSWLSLAELEELCGQSRFLPAWINDCLVQHGLTIRRLA